MANICPVCGYENIFGALVCANCYDVLTKLPPNAQESTVPTTSDSPDPQPSVTRPAVDTRPYGANAVIMFLNNLSEPLVVYIAEQAVLGRLTTEEGSQPRIDLSAYDAHDRGISRQHATIRRNDKGLTIEDLDSVNGTFINNKRLPPFTPVQLKPGDRLLLAKFSVVIYFH